MVMNQTVLSHFPDQESYGHKNNLSIGQKVTQCHVVYGLTFGGREKS